jgi:phosphatidylserine/phosphatidylglycerophosphate/cardiolipin synthase-like enzyme
MPTTARIRTRWLGGVLVGLAATLAVAVPFSAGDGDDAPLTAAQSIRFDTVFQTIDASRRQDLSIENRAIALTNATPAGERIMFAFRDFNRRPVVDALVAAKRRGVDVRGVIDGSERGRPALVPLKTALDAALVFCGSDVDFALHSCLANDPQYSDDGKSLQHNKFMTFSRLADGREHVVLETSMNFLQPSQLTFFNDAVEISGDAALHTGYEDYVRDMMEQGAKRTNDRYTGYRVQGDGPTTLYPSPRPQADLDTDDTIVDRLGQIDCSDGGTIRVANHEFRSERAVIMRKLAKLQRDGCDVDVIFSLAEGDIIAGLASAAIDVMPMFWRAQPDAQPALPEVRLHTKFWLVDAKVKATGERLKIAYVGSSNWRGNQQYSDDLLVRVIDNEVYDAYVAYWNLIAGRASTDIELEDDQVAPFVSLRTTPSKRAEAGEMVTVRVAASDGHTRNLFPVSGLDRLHVEVSGAQSASLDVSPPDPRLPAVFQFTVAASGKTTIRYHAVDLAGNAGEPHVAHVRVDGISE